VEGFSAGLILVSSEGVELTYTLQCNFKSSNNEMDYEALLVGLHLAQDLKVKNIKAHVDSLLVANQVSGNYDAKDHSMAKYLQKTKELMKSFNSCEVVYVPRIQNKKADALSELASVGFSHLAKEVRVQELQAPSIQALEVNCIQFAPATWMKELKSFLIQTRLSLTKYIMECYTEGRS
jgi:ribonuclease HI